MVIIDMDFRGIDFNDRLLEGVYMLDSQFDNMNLRCLNFFRARLCFSSYRSTILTKCDFGKADLEEADFTKAVLEEVGFVDSDCQKTDFTHARIKDCVFKDAYLSMADFTGARLSDTDITGAVFDRTILNKTYMKNISGIRLAMFKSINIGTAENPVVLEDQEACRWMVLNNR